VKTVLWALVLPGTAGWLFLLANVLRLVGERSYIEPHGVALILIVGGAVLFRGWHHLTVTGR